MSATQWFPQQEAIQKLDTVYGVTVPMPDYRRIERQLASVIHAARTAGPFSYRKVGFDKDAEQGLQNAKRKLLALIRGEAP